MFIQVNNAKALFNTLCQVASERAEELAQCEAITVQYGLDSEAETGASIRNLFLNESGSISIQKMTNVTVTKIEELYKNCEAYVNERFNTDRAKTLVTLHHRLYSWYLQILDMEVHGNFWQLFLIIHRLCFCQKPLDY